MSFLLAGVRQAGVKGCPIASGEGWWRRAQGLVLYPGNKHLSSAGCAVEEAAARRQRCGRGPLVPAVTPAVPEQAAGLAALPAELLWGTKLRMSTAITRDM